jgi:glutaredoxin-like protein
MLLEDRDRRKVQSELASLEHPVKLVVFTQELACDYCKETEQLAREVAELSDKLSVEVYNFVVDKEQAAKYRVDKIPALVVEGEKDYGIRFYGIPMGYEFVSLLGAIKDVARRSTGLAPETKAALAAIQRPLHLQVYVTPTCPYCPAAVRLAHQFAMESDFVTADMVEATEFPHLAMRYQVRGVPRTIVNEESAIEGGLPEAMFIQQVVAATSQS